MVQWLRLHTPNARGRRSIPDQGTRSHMLQLRPSDLAQADKYIKRSLLPHHHLYPGQTTWLTDLSSLTRVQSGSKAVKALNPNHWTIREFPPTPLFGMFRLAALALQIFDLHCRMRTLNCGMWDLVSSQGSNLGPLHWERRVLATGPPLPSCLWGEGSS